MKLKYCPDCLSMTNHIGNSCQRCKAISKQKEEIRYLYLVEDPIAEARKSKGWKWARFKAGAKLKWIVFLNKLGVRNDN